MSVGLVELDGKVWFPCHVSAGAQWVEDEHTSLTCKLLDPSVCEKNLMFADGQVGLVCWQHPVHMYLIPAFMSKITLNLLVL